jgi:hypothetical protein
LRFHYSIYFRLINSIYYFRVFIFYIYFAFHVIYILLCVRFTLTYYFTGFIIDLHTSGSHSPYYFAH